MRDKQKKERIIGALKAAFPLTLPVLTGFLVLGIAFGVLMRTKGFGLLWPSLMSAVDFCGSMQFVAIDMLSSFAPLQLFLMSLMVNARHLFYGVSMLERYRGMGAVKPFLIFALCDETFSIVSSADIPEGIDRKYFYLWVSLLDWSYWQIGTLIGAAAGALITFNTAGMDFALTALFVVLFVEQVRRKENRLPGLIGLGCALVSLVIFGADNLVLPAMAGILAILLTGGKKLCR